MEASEYTGRRAIWLTIMPDHTSVNFNDLLDAFLWVSGAAPDEYEAHISRLTGKIYWVGLADFGIKEELPEDIGNPDLYIGIPHKNDLDLGRSLVFRFTEAYLPESCDLVYGFFRKRRAYANFKDLLVQKGQLEHWHDYENKATEQALREWCEDNNLEISGI
jgi:hypothetical protein